LLHGNDPSPQEDAAGVSALSLPPRRRFIAGLVAVLASLYGAAFPRLWGGKGPVDPSDALLALLDDPPSAKTIGTACLSTLAPSERTPGQLIAAICARAALVPDDLASPDLGRRISDRVRRDFAQGAVVQVDGWFLSVTEARLYALTAAA
jgi:hypothetical protein